MTDTERFDWFGQQEGAALISGSIDHWAFVYDAVSFFVEEDGWCKTVRDAIDVAIVDERESEEK